MSGRDYLAAIKAELEAGRHQHRMGENILAAFGYVRRRQTAIDEIAKALEELGLVTDPPIDSAMPLRVPRIRFSLKALHETPVYPEEEAPDAKHGQEDAEDAEDVEPSGSVEMLVPAFRIAELEAADKPVECISPDAPLAQARTRMALNKFSQLVVANNNRPRQQDIKGIVSYQSIAKALLNGNPVTVRDCVDDSVPVIRSDLDLNEVVPLLGVHDVVLVVGQDRRLQGIVTAWDLAEEFAQLVDPFKRIGEVEARLRALLFAKLGRDRIGAFLSERQATASASNPVGDPDWLTIGDLQRILENPANWEDLGLRGVDRAELVEALDRIRTFRNRLMHFRDPLSPEETKELTNFCDMMRDIGF
jgi:CBS domain-containing protein